MLKPPYCRLETVEKKQPKDDKRVFTLYSKGVYSPGVKIHGWEYDVLAQPYDMDPLDEKSFNCTIGHYTTLGSEKLDYSTETKDKFTTPKTQNFTHYHPKLMNVYSYDENEPYIEDEEDFAAGHFFSDYSTTMQSSYKPPFPYVMQRLSLPATPFFLNRRLNHRIDSSSFKFYDEENNQHIKLLQKYKQHRHVSFNPWIGKYSNEPKYVE